MTPKTRDSEDIPESDFRREPDTMLLTIALTGRDDPVRRPRAARAWQHLVARRHDRIRTQIKLWEWPGQGVRVHPADHDDAFSRAWAKAENMLDTHREPAVAAFDAALRQAVEYACMDECRRRMTRERRERGSLDERRPGDDGERGGGRFDATLLAMESEREAARQAAADMLDSVAACIERMSNEDMRVVMRRTLEHATVQEIMAERGLSQANVYQLRRRALVRIHEEVLGDG